MNECKPFQSITVSLIGRWNGNQTRDSQSEIILRVPTVWASQYRECWKTENKQSRRVRLVDIFAHCKVDSLQGVKLPVTKLLKSLKHIFMFVHGMLNTCFYNVMLFLFSSLCTTLCLQWEPEIIAIALMYLASKLSKFEIQDWVGRTPRHTKWWDVFVDDLSAELLEGK